VEVGAAYGVTCIAAVKKGATVIANDLDARHLEILRSQLSDEEQSRVLTVTGSFPHALQLADNSISSICIANVLHFFDGPSIDEALAQSYRMLIPGGRLFVCIVYVDMKNYCPIFEDVIEPNRRAGTASPNYLNLHEYLRIWLAKPETKQAMPEGPFDMYSIVRDNISAGMYYMMKLDEFSLHRFGFEVNRCLL